MANSIRTTIRAEFLRDSVIRHTLPSKTETVATTSDVIHSTTQLVGTTHEVISAGDATDNVLTMLENLHATAYVEVGVVVSATFYPVFKIPAGETAKMPRTSVLATTYVKASAVDTTLLVTHYKVV